MVVTLLVNNGTDYITDLLTAATTAAATQYIGWGTGGSSTGGTATNTDTALEAEATEARATTAMTQPSADTAQWVGTLTTTTAKTIEEAAVFVSATVSTMIIRGSHAGVLLATSDSIQYTITLNTQASDG